MRRISFHIHLDTLLIAVVIFALVLVWIDQRSRVDIEAAEAREQAVFLEARLAQVLAARQPEECVGESFR